MKLATHVEGLLLAALLIPSIACGAHVKPRPNDEVTVPMNEEDESALRGEAKDDETSDSEDTPEADGTQPDSE